MNSLRQKNSEPETETVAVTVVNETAKAFLLRNDQGKESFFPKSQISFARRNLKTGAADVDVPVWLLDNNGW